MNNEQIKEKLLQIYPSKLDFSIATLHFWRVVNLMFNMFDKVLYNVYYIRRYGKEKHCINS